MRRVEAAVTIAIWAAVTTVAMAQDATADPAPAVPAGPVRVVDSDISVGNALEAKIELALGEVVVRGEDVDRIFARLQVFCEKKDLVKCEKQAQDLAVVGVADGNRVAIRIKGVSEAWIRRLGLRLEVRVPKRLPVDVHLHDGQLRIDDVAGSVKAEVDKGTIDLNLAEADIGELVLRAGGKATVEVAGETLTAKGNLSGELRWIRPGRIGRVEAKADIGDVRVVLN